MASKAEIAWAAGLFEGEGTITVSGGGVHLRISNTDKEVLDRFLAIVERGKIYGPYVNGYRDGFVRKPRWIWVCVGKEALPTYGLLAPWLGSRRRARARELGFDSM